MKVILLQDVARIGRKHEVKNVPDGHAQNHLIPRKLAEPATPQNLKRVAQRSANIEAEHAAAEAAFNTMVTQAKASPVTITAGANEQGHLFRGLRADDIARALAETTGVAATSVHVHLEKPIKETGEHMITITSGATQEQVPIIVSAA